MLVACRLAGLSALDAHYGRVTAHAIRADTAPQQAHAARRTDGLANFQPFEAELLSMQAGRSGHGPKISRSDPADHHPSGPCRRSGFFVANACRSAQGGALR
jgi:hypothetical protein